MKILLVFPRFRYISGQPPLGLAALYSYLRKEAPMADLTVFDATFTSGRLEAFRSALRDGNFDIVAFSVMSTMIGDFQTMAGIVRQEAPHAKIVAGGPHPTIDPEFFVLKAGADAAVVGEGEVTFCEYILNKADPGGVKGLVYKNGKEAVFGGERDKIEDIDSLPIPSRDMFDMASYVNIWNSMDSVSANLRGTSLIISRGCPYRCSFCQPTLRKIFGQNVRKRSASRITEELIYLKDAFNINAAMFEDDTFLMDKRWTEEVCDSIIKNRLNIVWCCNMRADLCEKKLLRRMYEAGLRKVNIGIESASQRILTEVLDKGIKIGQIEEAVYTAKDLGLKVQGYFMLGHCSESEDEIKQTIRFASALDIDEASFSITTPLPGTSLFEKDRSAIKDKGANYDYYSDCVYKENCMKVTPAKVERYKKYAYLMFYTRPKRFVRHIAEMFTPNGMRKLLYKLQRV